MSYRTTQFLFFFRKLSRDEEKKGDLKKRIMAMVLAVTLIYLWNGLKIGETAKFHNDEVYYSKTFLRDFEESYLLNTFFKMRGVVSPPVEIALVKVDDLTYQKLNLSNKRSIPRDIFAKALLAIQEDKPKLIILDFHAPVDELEEEGTIKLVEALKLGPTTIGRAPLSNSDSSYVSDPRIRDVAAMELPLVVDHSNSVTSYIQVGHGQKLPEERAFPLLPALKMYVNSELDTPPSDGLINFYGPAGTIQSYSIWQLMLDKKIIPRGFFKDKIVLMGFSSELSMRGVSNKEVLSVTAPGQNMYGVEIHATIAGNLLDKSWIKRIPAEVEIIAVMLLLFFLILGIFFLEPISAIVYVLIYLTLWFFGSYFVFLKLHYFFPGFLIALLSTPFILCGVMTTVARLALTELGETKKMLGIK